MPTTTTNTKSCSGGSLYNKISNKIIAINIQEKKHLFAFDKTGGLENQESSINKI
jgi:hypothetical protein